MVVRSGDDPGVRIWGWVGVGGGDDDETGVVLCRGFGLLGREVMDW